MGDSVFTVCSDLYILIGRQSSDKTLLMRRINWRHISRDVGELYFQNLFA